MREAKLRRTEVFLRWLGVQTEELLVEGSVWYEKWEGRFKAEEW